MNEVINEALRSALRRIAKLENDVRLLKSPLPPQTPPSPQNQALATPQQKNYLRTLGGKFNEPLTKKEAGILIDTLLNKQDVVEPQEVDTDDAGLDGELM
jgi:hypothetical protein